MESPTRARKSSVWHSAHAPSRIARSVSAAGRLRHRPGADVAWSALRAIAWAVEADEGSEEIGGTISGDGESDGERRDGRSRRERDGEGSDGRGSRKSPRTGVTPVEASFVLWGLAASGAFARMLSSEGWMAHNEDSENSHRGEQSSSSENTGRSESSLELVSLLRTVAWKGCGAPEVEPDSRPESLVDCAEPSAVVGDASRGVDDALSRGGGRHEIPMKQDHARLQAASRVCWALSVVAASVGVSQRAKVADVLAEAFPLATSHLSCIWRDGYVACSGNGVDLDQMEQSRPTEGLPNDATWPQPRSHSSADGAATLSPAVARGFLAAAAVLDASGEFC